MELPERKSVLATDYSGKIHIWGYEPDVQLVIRLDSPSLAEIRGLQVINNILCVGQIDGLVTLYDMGAPGKEKFTKQITQFQGKPGVRLVCIRDKPRREVITGDNTGVVTVWDLQSQQPVYVLQAHTDVITQMKWLEDKQLLVSCAKDKSLKVWKFPAEWINESGVQSALADIESQVEQSQA